jgi:hypothetical protein
MLDPEQFAMELAKTIRVEISKATGPLLDLIAELEAKIKAVPEKGEPGIQGIPGKDADPIDMDALSKLVADAIAKGLQEIPAPQNGRDGTDAAPIDMDAVDAMVNKRVAAAVAAIPAPKDGIDGRPGADAVAPDIEPLRREFADLVKQAVSALPTPKDGRDGQPGLPGTAGHDGDRGEKGDSGRDALQISIHPAIEEAKSYQRGTFASHLGGLWHATKATDGMDGWECIVEGIASVEHANTGEREVTVTTTLSSGTKSMLAYRFHDIIHRGTYDHAKTYDQGDQVAWGGSTWVALSDGIKEPPNSANTDKWVLGSKKGAEGASAYQSAKKAGFTGSEYDWVRSLKGERGPEGRSVR